MNITQKELNKIINTAINTALKNTNATVKDLVNTEEKQGDL
jgi:hypothetical protein